MPSAATQRCRTLSPRYSRIARKTAALFSKCRYTVRLATCAAWARSSMEVLRYPYRVNSSSAASTMAFGFAELSLAPAYLFLTFFIHITSNRTEYTITGYLVYLESRVEAHPMTRKRLIGFIAVIQSVLCLTHLFLYETWAFSPVGNETPGAFWIKLVLGFLSVSFIAASLLAFRYTHTAVRVFYRAAAVWVGMLTFLFVAAVSSWIIFGVARLAELDVNFHRTVELLLGAAVMTGLYGVLN